MAVRYVSTELSQGLRRNLSMHLAVIITLLVSMTLAGVGFLLNEEAKITQKRWGSELQITIYLCNGITDVNKSCHGGVTGAQKSNVESTLKQDPYVAGVKYESKADAYERIKHIGLPASNFSGPKPIVAVNDMWESYWVTMKDPHHVTDIEDSVKGLDGVDRIQDMRDLVGQILTALDAIRWVAVGAAILLVFGALLLVSNTVRLAAFARRREIGIMRLVGASSLYIMLPFLLEVLVTAVIGAALACGVLAGIEYFGVIHGLARLQWNQWIGWPEYVKSVFLVFGLSIVLTLVPALLMTRRYVKI